MENFKSTEALLSWIVDYIFIPFGSKKNAKMCRGIDGKLVLRACSVTGCR
jgi:hypothetical protein